MTRRSRLSAIALAAMTGIAAMSGGGTPSPVQAPVAPSTVSPQAPTTPTSAPAAAQRVVTQSEFAMIRAISRSNYRRNIWNGSAKRGSRRGRSRWNYNR